MPCEGISGSTLGEVPKRLNSQLVTLGRFFDQYQQYQEHRDPPRDQLGPQIGNLSHSYNSCSTSARGIEVQANLDYPFSFVASAPGRKGAADLPLTYNGVCVQYCYAKGPGMQKWSFPGSHSSMSAPEWIAVETTFAMNAMRETRTTKLSDVTL